MKVWGLKVLDSECLVEIGGGEGFLAEKLLKSGSKLKCFVEPDAKKMLLAKRKIDKSVVIHQGFLNDVEVVVSCKEHKELTVVMQDVIEHIPKDELVRFFSDLRSFGVKLRFIGRTPNLKSPFGLRNSFGDNTHIHRFTDHSLNEFLKDLGFNEILIRSEPFEITGVVSFIRFFPYQLIMALYSLSLLAVFGQRETGVTPNIVFDAK